MAGSEELGAHMSIAGGLHLALERRHALGCCAADLRQEPGSGLDRHENIGRGNLGLTPFRLLLNDRRFRAVPKVLETPKDPEPAADLRNLAVLRRLRALTAPRSRPPDGKAR